MLDLVPTTAHHTGKVGKATIHIMEAKEMWASALAALEKEPLCLVVPANRGGYAASAAAANWQTAHGARLGAFELQVRDCMLH